MNSPYFGNYSVLWWCIWSQILSLSFHTDTMSCSRPVGVYLNYYGIWHEIKNVTYGLKLWDILSDSSMKVVPMALLQLKTTTWLMHCMFDTRYCISLDQTECLPTLQHSPHTQTHSESSTSWPTLSLYYPVLAPCSRVVNVRVHFTFDATAVGSDVKWIPEVWQLQMCKRLNYLVKGLVQMSGLNIFMLILHWTLCDP